MPEEINRIMTDHLSSLLFWSSAVGSDNLKKEGITYGVHVSGDIMVDAFTVLCEIATSKFSIMPIFPV